MITWRKIPRRILKNQRHSELSTLSFHLINQLRRNMSGYISEKIYSLEEGKNLNANFPFPAEIPYMLWKGYGLRRIFSLFWYVCLQLSLYMLSLCMLWKWVLNVNEFKDRTVLVIDRCKISSFLLPYACHQSLWLQDLIFGKLFQPLDDVSQFYFYFFL